MSIIKHVETFLGTLEEGWKPAESASGIRVAGFSDQPFEGVVTYVTLGLSEHVLPMNNGRTVREELVFSAYKKFPREAVASFLLTFSDYLVTKHRALLRGDVVGPSEPVIPGASLHAIYAAMPVVFAEGFSTYRGTTPPTVLVWLLPIHRDEVEFVRTRGWNQFEDVLEGKDPDLWDLNREKVV